MVDKIKLIALDDEILALLGGGNIELSQLSTNVINYFVPQKANTLNVHANTLTIGNTYSSRILYCTNSTYNTVITLANSAQTGVSVTIIQGTAKNVRCIPETTATLVHRNSYANTAGRWATISVTVLENANGAGAQWLLMGDAIT